MRPIALALAQAHLDGLRYLRDGGTSAIFNVGYGHGYSVREVLAAVSRANGAPGAFVDQPCRAGDPPMLVAEARRISEVLGWQALLDDLDAIARTLLEWERGF